MITHTKNSIAVNQIGYPCNGKKIAIFSENHPFHIKDVQSLQIVFSGQVGNAIHDNNAGKIVYQGDFSSFNTPGKYIIEQNHNTSFPFEIQENPYSELLTGLTKAFYYLRCGTKLSKTYAGCYKHKACHTKKGIVYDKPNLRLDGSGGWHDAGDYGKYTVAGAKAVCDLLLAYEFFPSFFLKPIPLPETDGRMPDILHECRYELEWLLKMQNKDGGGVYHKLTTLQFPSLHTMPEKDVSDLYFSPISGTATASFSAIMAKAYSIYLPFDQSFAERCLLASRHAWNWLEHYPEVPGFKNPPGIATGEYGDESDTDERYWAAAELYRATGESTYHDAFKNLASKPFSKTKLGWVNVGGYGTIAYLQTNQSLIETSLYLKLRESFLKEANRLVAISKVDGYKLSLEEKDYVWGSNMEVMNHGMTLLFANKLQPNMEYTIYAMEHVHYLLGRNVLNTSYVTGFGSKQVMNLHHRPSVADKVPTPIPGYVVGGPDRHLSDPTAKDLLAGRPPAQCFIDHQESYATNEITIYWNSPAVFVVAGVMEIYNTSKKTSNI